MIGLDREYLYQETEHTTPIVVLYRGGRESQPTNPFMESVISGLRQRGLNILDHSIDPTIWENQILPLALPEKAIGVPYEEITRRALATVGEIEPNSILVTDIALNRVGNLIDKSSITAHEHLGTRIYSFDDIRRLIGPIIRAIRHDGKEPVVFSDNLTIAPIDKYDITFSDEEVTTLAKENPFHNNDEVKKLNWVKYSLSIKALFGAPVINNIQPPFRKRLFLAYEGQPWSIRDSLETFQQVLEKINIDPARAVLIGGHYLGFRLDPDTVENSGLNQIEFARICPCCLCTYGEINKEGAEVLKRRGFKMYPIDRHFPGQYDKQTAILDQLESRIRQRAIAIIQSSTPEVSILI